MGIPGFYGSWLRSLNTKHYDYKILLKRLPVNISSLSLDFNAMLHKIAQKVYSYGDYKDSRREKIIENMTPEQLMQEFYQVLETEFITLISTVNPKDALVIAFDGPAPYSKIAQQRRRRYKSSPTKFFDPTNISTGTEFMSDVDEFVRDLLNKYMNMLPPKIILSSPYVEGEGEHKIAKFLSNGEVKGKDYHVIYAKDADLSIISLHIPQRRILVARESLFDIINIDGLKQWIFDNMKTKSAILDFIYIITLIGNDFMPGVVSSRGIFVEFINKLIEVYAEKRLSIIQYSKINYANLKELLTEFAKYENDFLLSVSKVKFEYPLEVLNANIENGKLNKNAFRKAWYNRFLSPRKASEYNLEKEFAVKKSDVESLVNEYVMAMSWVFLYYTRNESFNNRWLYVQLYAPLLYDLANLDVEYLSRNETNLKVPLKTMSAAQQLMCIVPYESRKVLSKEYRKLLSTDSPIIYNYPVNFDIDKEGFLSTLEYIAILPPPYFEKVIEAINSLGIEQEYDEDVIITKEIKK